MSTTFAAIVEEIRALDKESKEDLLELIRSWLIEERRGDILLNADRAEAEQAEGQTKSGDVEALMADLYAED